MSTWYTLHFHRVMHLLLHQFVFDQIPDYSYMLQSAWWRHQMETFSALLVLCVGNSPVTGEFPSQRPVTWSFDVFFDLRPNKRLSKQAWGWWFETSSLTLWRHCNGYVKNDAPKSVIRLAWDTRGDDLYDFNLLRSLAYCLLKVGVAALPDPCCRSNIWFISRPRGGSWTTSKQRQSLDHANVHICANDLSMY